MEQTIIDFKALYREMQRGLTHVNRLRRLVRCLIPWYYFGLPSVFSVAIFLIVVITILRSPSASIS